MHCRPHNSGWMTQHSMKRRHISMSISIRLETIIRRRYFELSSSVETPSVTCLLRRLVSFNNRSAYQIRRNNRFNLEKLNSCSWIKFLNLSFKTSIFISTHYLEILILIVFGWKSTFSSTFYLIFWTFPVNLVSFSLILKLILYVYQNSKLTLTTKSNS